MYIHHELLRIQEKRGVSDAMPRLGEHVSGRSGRLLVRCERGEGLEEKYLRACAVGDAVQEVHHRLHARLAGRDEGDKKIWEPEVGPMNVLRDNGAVRCEFLVDRGALYVVRVERLGGAIRLNAGKEYKTSRAGSGSLDPEGRCVRTYFCPALLMTNFIGDRDALGPGGGARRLWW